MTGYRLVAFALLGLAFVAHGARAQESHFAVVNLTPAPQNVRVVAAVENEIARLRPGSRPIEDTAMRRLLGSGEDPSAMAARLLREGDDARIAGDCTTAV